MRFLLSFVCAAAALLVLPFFPEAAPRAAAGSIRGIVRTASATSPAIKVAINEHVCGQTQPDQTLVVGPNGGVAFAVVTLAGTNRLRPDSAPGASSGKQGYGGQEAGAPSSLAVTNQHCRFSPRVQVARPGASLKITSDDQVLHTTHAYAEDERTLFNIALPMPSLSFTRPLARARLVRLACDTHPWMRGFIVLTDEIAAVTGADGSFTLADVPAGTYELRIWHEKLKSPTQKVTVADGGTTEVSIAAVP